MNMGKNHVRGRISACIGMQASVRLHVMVKSTLLLLAMLLLKPLIAGADEAPLTNADVFRMTSAGLSAQTIVAKISTSRGDYRTDTDSLVALASSHVDDSVIRAMIERQSVAVVAPPGQPAAAPAPPSPPARSPAPGRIPSASRRKRFEEVTVETRGGGHCDHADLEVTSSGLKTTGCHETDINVLWSAVDSVCYVFGFRGTLIVRTATEERRISTTTPVAMKTVRDAIRSRWPKTRETTGCR